MLALRSGLALWALSLALPAVASAQDAASISGQIRDQVSAPLAGVSVELAIDGDAASRRRVESDQLGRYAFTALPAGRYQLTFSAPGFATFRPAALTLKAGAAAVRDVTLPLAISTEVVVTGTRTFRNLADLDHPEAGLVGIARSASEGAVTGQQIADRPVMRAAEVLETVPGLIISQHSGEGKANQYYLRGFNLDHGTDFSTVVAGVPVNLPTHAHGHGYSDANFLIPELVTGVQFRKGPYFSESGDFSAAGAANITYANVLERPFLGVSFGQQGWRRLVAGASPRVGGGHVLLGVEIGANDGPWTRPDDFRKVNGIVRYTRSTTGSAFSITGQAYDGKWNATDQVPQRAIDSGLIDRFGGVDPTTGGDTGRYSVATEFERSSARSRTRVTAFALRYRLNLFSNFTYALDNPDDGDQFEQADRRWVTGAKLSHRRLATWRSRPVELVAGTEVRYDHIPHVGLFRTAGRVRLDTVREDAVRQTSVGAFGQADVDWTPWLRSSAGLRVDGYRFAVDADDPLNSGTDGAGLVSPKGGVVFGPWRRTELYVNAGYGYHSNDARGSTITRDPTTGEEAFRVTPLVRAKGAEVGVRTIIVPRTQMTLTLWRLDLDSELLFVGDAGTTESGRPSDRYGVEWSAYTRVRPWLVADADVAWSHARFSDDDPAGNLIPGSLQTVVSSGLTVDSVRRVSGSVRLRYFGPRPLIEDGSVKSKATTIVNGQAAYDLTPRLRLVARRIQSLQSRGERHRLLLRLPPARRARRRRRGRPHASGPSPGDQGRRCRSIPVVPLQVICECGPCNGKRRPLAGPRVHVNRRAGVHREHLNDRKAEPCALSGFLGREERLEDARADLVGNAGAVVGDVEPDSGAVGIRFGRHCHAAAGVNRVTCVDDQIHHDALDLTAVGLDFRDRVRELECQVGLRAHGALQRAGLFSDDVADVQRARQQLLLLAERNELARHARGRLGGRLDLERVPARRRAVVHAIEHEIHIAEDHHQQVVDVVRDAARQSANRLVADGLAPVAAE